MERKGAAAVALVAGFVNAVIIAIAGNQWYRDHVALKSSSNGANRILKQIPTAFSWRLDHWGSNQRALRVGEVAGIGTVVVMVFLLTWIVIGSQRRPRGFFGPFFAIWGIEVFSVAIAGMVMTFLGYPDVYGSGANPLGTTRFWFALLTGPSNLVILWGIGAGLITALLCALITVGQRVEVTEEEDEDTFFPPRTPQLAAPAATASAVGADTAHGNPELAAYGWSPEQEAEHTRTLPTSEGGSEGSSDDSDDDSDDDESTRTSQLPTSADEDESDRRFEQAQRLTAPAAPPDRSHRAGVEVSEESDAEQGPEPVAPRTWPRNWEERTEPSDQWENDVWRRHTTGERPAQSGTAEPAKPAEPAEPSEPSEPSEPPESRPDPAYGADPAGGWKRTEPLDGTGEHRTQPNG